MTLMTIFTICLTNNSVCINSIFLLENKIKNRGEYIFYLVPFLIVLNVRLYWLVINVNAETPTYKNHKLFCL